METLFEKLLQPVFDKPDETGSSKEAVDDTTVADDKSAEDTATETTTTTEADEKLTRAQALLKKEKSNAKAQSAKVKELEEKLSKFEGVDLEEFQKLVGEKKAAEEAKRQADKDAAASAGDFERVKAMMAEDHAKQIAALKEQYEATVSELQTSVSGYEATLTNYAMDNSFASSAFLREETILTPAKAKKIYGDYFEVVDGKVVAYDKPSTESDRTPLTDASGSTVSFEEAIKRIINGDSDKDAFLRSKTKAGAGSLTSNREPLPSKGPEISGRDVIEAALKANPNKWSLNLVK